jgi:hypothetical protein
MKTQQASVKLAVMNWVRFLRGQASPCLAASKIFDKFLLIGALFTFTVLIGHGESDRHMLFVLVLLYRL